MLSWFWLDWDENNYPVLYHVWFKDAILRYNEVLHTKWMRFLFQFLVFIWCWGLMYVMLFLKVKVWLVECIPLRYRRMVLELIAYATTLLYGGPSRVLYLVSWIIVLCNESCNLASEVNCTEFNKPWFLRGNIW